LANYVAVASLVAIFALAFCVLMWVWYFCKKVSLQRNMKGNGTLSFSVLRPFQALVKSSAITSSPCSLRKLMRKRFLDADERGNGHNTTFDTYRTVLALLGLGTGFWVDFFCFAIATSSADGGLYDTSSAGLNITRSAL
jgi:hypothetical protein